MTTILKTCPCCGAEAKPQIPMMAVFQIRCSNGDCGCLVSGKSIDDAAARWNRRAGGKELDYDALQPDLDRLAEIGKRLGWPQPSARLLALAADTIDRAYPAGASPPFDRWLDSSLEKVSRKTDICDTAERDLLLLLAQIITGTMLRPDAGLLIYLDDGRSTVRHIPTNVRDRLIDLMAVVRPSL
jgi:hypothetical protein